MIMVIVGFSYRTTGIATSPLTIHAILAGSYVTNNIHFWIRMGKYIQVISTKSPRKPKLTINIVTCLDLHLLETMHIDA